MRAQNDPPYVGSRSVGCRSFGSAGDASGGIFSEGKGLRQGLWRRPGTFGTFGEGCLRAAFWVRKDVSISVRAACAERLFPALRRPETLRIRW